MSPPWESIATLLLTSLAIMGSPGPATVSLTAIGSAFGVRRCLGYLVGIILGTITVLLAVATGITAALLAVPALRSVLLLASAAYILWLAWHIARAPALADRRQSAKAPSIAGGALLGVANPKAWVAIAAVFASARLSDEAWTDAVLKVVLLVGMIILINTAWLSIGASLAPVLRDPGRSRAVNVTLAIVLVAATAFAIVH